MELPSHPGVEWEEPTTPKVRSISHNMITREKAILISFEIETGGEYCGILQIPDEIFRLELVPGGRKNTKYKSTNIKREADTFNKYVNPGSGDLWNENCMAIHGFHPTHKSIASADPMAVVWCQFEEWIQSYGNF